MLLILASLLQPIPEDVGIGLRVGPPTVEERTYPQYDFDCRLTLTNSEAARLQFEQTGARGYIDENESDPDLRVKQTPATLRLIGDSADLLKGYTLDSYYSPGFGKIRGFNERDNIELDVERTDIAGLKAIVVRVGGPYATVRAIGLCEVNEKPQFPLTEAETSEVATK
ncbi:hypothetical protein [Leptolyngbya sp. 7M]|uniref:hypothetical protein n=1 Tax=Leptolyngbya sp. 7M TaxID=2812896 RepID=UPI001B8D9329|nr:hypothetical protein [Leptolyngbya sp. 7M]QYO64056.1 hypothetical protein JVX88_30465 [Leptolyngbya sp. 7M]QYU66199.1 hypothetical protein J4558_14475 [Leptolyngbya sp. 15MV]